MDENKQPPIAPANPSAELPAHPAFMPSNPAMSPPARKPSKWRHLLTTLGTLQVVGIALFFLILLSVGGKTGSEFVALFLFVSIVPAVVVIAVINLIALPIYLRKQKPRGAGLVFSIISLAISAVLALYGGYVAYQMYVVVPQYTSERAVQTQQKIQADRTKYAADNAKPEITKDEAITLLQTCKLKGFYYTQEAKVEHSTSPARSQTGIVLTKIDGEPFRINIADRLIAELVPIARAAQSTCGDLQFWHDGVSEQAKDGKWYFKDQVVNDMRPLGKTREEALSLMRDCKVDYFVGYTDMNLVHDASTKSWLEKAEQSNTGIEISEESVTSFVFTSKVVAAEMQDTVRQIRQSCYGTKKLYITIDDWIETEYPIGTWTKLKQRQ